jgi:4-hydroxybenzoate polyprenyltransferase
MPELGTAMALWRSSHPEPVVAVTAAAGLLAASSGRGARRAILATGAVFAGQLLTGWTNDLLDLELDRRAARTDKPLANGELRPAAVRRAMAAAFPAALLLSRAGGPRGIQVHGAGLALAAAYNLGLKRTPLSFVPYAGAFALLPVYALGKRPPAWTLAAASMMGAAAHLGQVLPDVASDRRAGVLGLPQRLGTVRSSLGVAALLSTAAALLSVATRRPATALISAGGAAVSPSAAAAGLANRPRLAFRLTMGAAGLLVAAYSVSLRVPTPRRAARSSVDEADQRNLAAADRPVVDHAPGHEVHL